MNLQAPSQSPSDDDPFPSIRRRAVFFVGGYDPQSIEGFFARLSRELRRFETTWGVEASIQQRETPTSEVGQVRVVASKGDLWQVETDFHFLTLDSIVLKDFAKPLPLRLMRYLRAFADYVFTGTAFRIATRAWRFFLYFLYPFATLVGAVAVCLAAGGALAGLAGAESAGPGLIAALVLLVPLTMLMARKTSVVHLMDLWSFSLDFIRERKPEAVALLDHFASHVADQSRNGGYDEILLAGHSTGGGLILDVAGRILRLDPDFAGSSSHVSLLTVGSTALKFGLHPAAGDFRRKVQELVGETRLEWAEYQCMIDPINFYRVDPVEAMGLARRDAEHTEAPPFPLIRQVHMRKMLDEAAYKRIRKNFLRVHYQFIMGNTARYFYDFFMVCFGPTSLPATARRETVDPRLTGERNS